jgi:hypothetical protein
MTLQVILDSPSSLPHCTNAHIISLPLELVDEHDVELGGAATGQAWREAGE